MRTHSAVLSLLVAALLAVGLGAGCSMLPANQEVLDALESQRAELEAARSKAETPDLQAAIDAAIRANRDAATATVAKDTGERTGLGLDALEMLALALGGGAGVGTLLQKFGRSRSAGQVDELWDKVSALQAALAAVRARMEPTPTNSDAGPPVA